MLERHIFAAYDDYATQNNFTFKAICTVTVTVEGDGTAYSSLGDKDGIQGEEVTLTPTPNPGYQFKDWEVVSGGVTVTDNKFTIGTQDVKIKAVFEKKKYSVTVTNDGNGTASANPTSGEEGTVVSLTPTANAGYQFKGWQVNSGGVTVADNKFTIGNENVEIEAIFEENSSASYIITFNAGEGGTGTMSSLNVGAGSFKLPPNDFTAPEGKDFGAWQVNGEEKKPGEVIEVNGNITITAIWTGHVHNFGTPTYTWSEDYETVTAQRTCQGDDSYVETETVDTTSEVKAPATCTEKGSTAYKATFKNEAFKEQTKTIANIEVLGHDWGGWIVTTPASNYKNGVETRTCNRYASHTETRTIAKTGITSYTITVSSNSVEGSASASAGTAGKDETVRINVTPNVGYELDKITYAPEGGSANDITSERSFTMPEANVIVDVTFKESTEITPEVTFYKVTFVADKDSEVLEQIVQANERVAKPADPQKEGYIFAGWYTDEDFTEEYNFNTRPVTADVTVYAKWNEKTYTVTVTNDGNGSAVADQESGVAGTVVTLTATPNEGYRFMKWVVISGGVTVTDNKFTIGNENVQVMAIFEEIPKATKPDDPIKPGTKDTPKTNDSTNTSNNGGTTPQPPAASAAEFKVGDTVKDGKTKASFVITSTETNKETVTYVSTTNKNTVTTLTVPNTVTVGGKKYKVTEIKANAFKDNKKLKKITIGKNIEKIGKNAFSGCKNLKTVNIKTTKLTRKTVGANAFKGINAKAKVTVPGSKLKAYKTILKARGIKGKNQKIK